jgi:glutamine amidotransferase-like uncharacterized protein
MSRSILLTSQRSLSPKVAIYNDRGVWPVGRAAVENMLTALEVSWQLVSAKELNAGDLQVDVLWLPGGWSGDYEEQITLQGMEHIRQFVHAGGRFVGICAGAFFASALIVWEGETFDYPFGLFAGEAVGPIVEIAPWPQRIMTSVHLETQHAMNITLATPRQQLYYGGPAFTPNNSQTIDIVATYAETGEPAAITLQYGTGRVFLTGLHFETGPECTGQENKSACTSSVHGADWEFGRALLDWLLPARHGSIRSVSTADLQDANR